jgi:uncharacterized protein (DUF1015 family)
LIKLSPVKRALVPIDSDAAARISGSNYDEFQDDLEIWDILQQKPENILRITMAHVDVPDANAMMQENSPEALNHAAENMVDLIQSSISRTAESILWVYEIKDPNRPNIRQIGLGGFVDTGEVRTDQNPQGSIVRNEGVNQKKVDGRVALISKTKSYIGMVNLSVEDSENLIQNELQTYADACPSDYEAMDAVGNQHCIWIISNSQAQAKFKQLLEAEPYAYVADGNHRSLAAVQLGYEHFLGVCFPASSMGLAPYHRLVKADELSLDALKAKLETSFEVEALGDLPEYQPLGTLEIGFYTKNCWLRLTPKPDAFNPSNAVEVIAANIVQRKIFDEIFGIEQAADERLKYVGGNKDTAYLKRKVDEGAQTYAISLAPVTMNQFMEVCRQGRYMPPKSTWFSPKVRSGLVIALIDDMT